MSDRVQLLTDALQMRCAEAVEEPHFGGVVAFTDYAATDGESCELQCEVIEEEPSFELDAEEIDQSTFKLDNLTVEEIYQGERGTPRERIRVAAREMLGEDKYRAFCAEQEAFLTETRDTEVSEIQRLKHLICMCMQATLIEGDIIVGLSPALFMASRAAFLAPYYSRLPEAKRQHMVRAAAVAMSWMTQDISLRKERDETLGQFAERVITTCHLVGAAIVEGITGIIQTLDIARYL